MTVGDKSASTAFRGRVDGTVRTSRIATPRDLEPLGSVVTNAQHMKAVLGRGMDLHIAYPLRQDGKPYHELRADYFDRRNRDNMIRALTRHLQEIGVNVAVTETISAQTA